MEVECSSSSSHFQSQEEEQIAALQLLIHETEQAIEREELETAVLLELILKKRLRNITEVRPNSNRGAKKRKNPAVSGTATATAASEAPTAATATPRQKKAKAETVVTDNASASKRGPTASLSQQAKDPIDTSLASPVAADA